MSRFPDVVTEDRAAICKIIDWMLDADKHGIYPTTEAYNKFEELLQKVRMEAVGWAWAEACVQLDTGKDPRKFDQSILVDRAPKELNLPWKPKD